MEPGAPVVPVSPATRLERTVASASPHTQGREPGRLKRMPTIRLDRPGSQPLSGSALGDVHRDFHAEPEISGLRSFPFHDDAPGAVNARTRYRKGSPILAHRAAHRIRGIMKLGS